MITRGHDMLHATSPDGIDFNGTYDDPCHTSGRDAGAVQFKYDKNGSRHGLVGYCQWQGDDGNRRDGLYHFELKE